MFLFQNIIKITRFLYAEWDGVIGRDALYEGESRGDVYKRSGLETFSVILASLY